MMGSESEVSGVFMVIDGDKEEEEEEVREK